MENSSGRRSSRRNKGKAPAEMAPASDNTYLNQLNCTNMSCGAVLPVGSEFCRYCSCHICGRYDAEKDPSLWFACEPDCPQDDCCLQKCHIECAYTGGYMGSSIAGPFLKRDASYWCISCGKTSDILGCWMNQLSIAKDAKTVDVLCSRISLSHKLLDNTVRYDALHVIVTDVKSKLEAELGSIDRISGRVGRGLVSRLCVARDVQKLCADAIEMATTSTWAADPRAHGGEASPSCRILVESVSSTSFVIDLVMSPATQMDITDSFGLWCWRWRLEEPHQNPDLSFPASNRQIKLSNLHPSTEYAIKVISFSKTGVLGISEAKFSTKDGGIAHMNPDPPGTVGSGDVNPCQLSDVPIISDHPEEGLPSAIREQDFGPSERATEVNGSPSGMDVTILSVDPNAGIEQDYGPSERAMEFQAGDCLHSGPLTHLDLNADPLPDLNQYPIPSSELLQAPPAEPSQAPAEPSQAPPAEPSQAPAAEPSQAPAAEPSQAPSAEPSQAPSAEPSQAEDSICLLPDVGNDGVDASPGILLDAPPKDPPLKSSSPKDGNGDWVQTIRGLEREGHISKEFRMKFFSWFSFKATEEEKRIVYSYFEALSDDSQCLGEQLTDSFSDILFGQAKK